LSDAKTITAARRATDQPAVEHLGIVEAVGCAVVTPTDELAVDCGASAVSVDFESCVTRLPLAASCPHALVIARQATKINAPTS
jgi:hypothetical protein